MSIRQTIFFNVTLSLVFSVTMSFAMTAMNVGFVPEFLTLWLSSAKIGFGVSIPIAFVFVPPIHKLTMRWIRD
ncbi:Protein of unknown function [Sporobacter termitidis DSM 10068]|uniref:DUF2798 domain-containing protein n=1 Tax=Sporobacter termitidis DSM 10068 TaxID=1123282 RepID=A0A1M5WZC9_9FIRM|nr:DUF2798 domain-containing protein [Sporobacter termitidis]SHH92702.1 Protein of unknown function [Sporobacter termitidis DSM 10068]